MLVLAGGACYSSLKISSRAGAPPSGTRASSSSAIASCHRAETSCWAMKRDAASRSSDSKYPNISRFIATMKARPNWEKVNAPFYQYFVGPFKDKEFAGLATAAA